MIAWQGFEPVVGFLVQRNFEWGFFRDQAEPPVDEIFIKVDRHQGKDGQW